MISVLIVSYQVRQHLEHCLRQLEEQLQRPEGPDFEVVVVDNASQDGSPDMVRRDFPWVRLVTLDQNLGFGAGNNRAAEEATGDRLLLLNADAWLADGALAAMDRALDADPRRAAVAPRLLYPDGRRQFHWAPATSVVGEALQMARNRFEDRAWVHREPPRWLWPLLGAPWYTAACLLLRRRAFEEVGGFDDRFFLYFEDVDLCLRLRHAGWRLATAAGAEAYHVKGGSELGVRAEIEYRRAQLRFYRRHRPRWEQAVLRLKLRRKLARSTDPELRRALAELLG